MSSSGCVAWAEQEPTREENLRDYERDLTNPEDPWHFFRATIVEFSRESSPRYMKIPELQETLTEVWEGAIHAVKCVPASSADIDRLVVLVVEGRELESFGIRETRYKGILPKAGLRPSTIPYLGQVFQDFWVNESMGLTLVERESVAVLTAKLYAVGINTSELSFCALWLFKQTFEVERPLTRLAEEDDGEDHNCSIDELLPVCLAWLKNYKYRILEESVNNHNPTCSLSSDVAEHVTSLGGLALESGIPNEGFSLARWLFWRRRLGAFHRCGNKYISKVARDIFEEMIMTGWMRGIKVPGENRFMDKSNKAILELMNAKDYNPEICLELDVKDIEIDIAWAEEPEEPKKSKGNKEVEDACGAPCI
ncbi:hypothetical protein BBP40_006863 [Aspergillus hancockii]|nr:hypothetical protein BBP40_006863 [Aspergillus hancockii]